MPGGLAALRVDDSDVPVHGRPEEALDALLTADIEATLDQLG
jgi:hypothetical protein